MVLSRLKQAELIRLKRIQESLASHKHREEHYAKYQAKAKHNRINKIAPQGVLLDKRGFRV